MGSTRTLALLLACLLSLGIVACGDDDGENGASGQPQAFEVEAGDDGVTAPETVEPGAVEIRFSNTGERPHSGQLVELTDGRTPEEVQEAGAAWGEGGGELPEWVTFLGGVGSVEPGGASTAIVDLPAGEYAIFDLEGEGESAYATFTVEGDEQGGLPETDGRVEAVDYSFNVEELGTGSQSISFENTGDEPHHLVGMPLLPGKTEADLQEFIETEKGRPPVDESKAFDTAILSGGQSAVVDVRLESGDYAFLCFIPDRAGGPPHVAKGMAVVTTVE